jgi:hypothetical protein
MGAFDSDKLRLPSRHHSSTFNGIRDDLGKNPNGGEEIAHRSPQEIMDEIAARDAESAEVLGNIKALL